MEKAYNTKVLIEELKAKGLDLSEDAAVHALDAVLAWIEKSAKLSENTYDDLLLAVLPLVKPELMKQIDKIDGQEG